ncbi:MAG: hypothetical protein KAY59_09695, partial [Acidobacteria bacterium]|nr:hypothetical protein [Acidobacteriota bacterium]
FTKMLAVAEIRKWPRYLRNVKQVMRACTPPFDERAYGFANLTDMLRAAHKENIVRMERDRQGVIRVFQGTSATSATAEPTETAAEPATEEQQPLIIVTGPEVVDEVAAQIIDDDHDPDDVNGNVAEPAEGSVAPARDKGKSRRRPQRQAPAQPARGSRRKPAPKKK